MDNVLFIEDGDIFAELLRPKIPSKNVVIASSLEEAQMYLSNFKFDIIISDLEDCDRRSQLMEIDSESCIIPILFLNQKPQGLSFRDKLGSYYSKGLDKVVEDYDTLLLTRIQAMTEGLLNIVQSSIAHLKQR